MLWYAPVYLLEFTLQSRILIQTYTDKSLETVPTVPYARTMVSGAKFAGIENECEDRRRGSLLSIRPIIEVSYVSNAADNSATRYFSEI